MGKEQLNKPGFVENSAAILKKGGIIAGIIGLFTSGQVLLAGVIAAVGGWWLEKNRQSQRLKMAA